MNTQGSLAEADIAHNDDLHVFDRFEATDLIGKLLEGMYAELPDKKPKKSKRD